MKIIAIVVTHNRLHLLKTCLMAINSQVRQPDVLLIVNNSSTDGTLEWLIQEQLPFVTRENKGGAGGFNEGLRLAYSNGADWIWLMDDDTIPEKHALYELEKGMQHFSRCNTTIGFFTSQVLWTDGTPHLMNRTCPYEDENLLSQCLHSLPAGKYHPIAGASFVSILVSREAVSRVGLPIKEFFIWHDDTEYTRRMVAAGMPGILVKDSIAVHQTPVNYKNDIYTDSVQNIWKYNCGLRNELYTRKMYKGSPSFWRNVAKRVVVYPFYILKKRRDHRWAFIKAVWRSSLAAITFNPAIETVHPNKKP